MNIVAEIKGRSIKFYELSGRKAKNVHIGVAEYARLADYVSSECKSVDKTIPNKIFRMKIIPTDKESECSFT